MPRHTIHCKGDLDILARIPVMRNIENSQKLGSPIRYARFGTG